MVDLFDGGIRMNHNTLLILGFAALALNLAPATSLPSGETLETSSCNLEDEYFTPGKTYEYTYKGKLVGRAVGTTPESNGIQIACNLLLNANGDCHYTLTVDKWCNLNSLHAGKADFPDEKVLKHHKSDEFYQQMKRYPVSFTLANATVWSITAHEKENLSILNVKKGIITTFIARKRPTTGKREMRTDVQGTCPVEYYVNNEIVTMTKYMQDCHFPSKSDWFYSPMSLFWNMSFIQTFWIKSESKCEYQGNGPRGLVGTSCVEKHAILLESTQDAAISVQTTITQTLSLKNVMPLVSVTKDTNNQRRTNIQYEYERITIPTNNPTDLEKRAANLMELLIIDVQQPFEPDTTVAFGQLIDLLREAVDLTELTKEIPVCFGIKKCKLGQLNTPKYTDTELQFGQIWRDALFQCNRLPCYRAIRVLLNLEQDYVKYVLPNDYLYFMLYTWTNIQITSIDIIQEILEICKLKPEGTCSYSLSTIIFKFWTEQKTYLRYKIPTTIQDAVKFMTKPINVKCSTELYDTDDIVKALQTFSNLGEVVEMVFPDTLENIYACIVDENNYKYHSVRALAIQATQRLQPSDTLYNHLWSIVENPKLQLEERALAYKVLAKKYGSPKFVEDVVNWLDSGKTTYHLKTFILTLLKSVLLAKEPSKAQFSRAIRNSLAPRLFDLDVDDVYISEHWQNSYFHDSPFMRENMGRFSYDVAVDYFYNNDSFTNPFSMLWKNRLTLFGKRVNLLEVFMTLKRLEDKIAVDHNELKFPYKVDETILNNLIKLQEKWTDELPEKLSVAKDSIISLKLLGESLGFFSYSTIKMMYLRSGQEPAFPISSRYWKVVEAFNQVPTLCGLPLNWTTDAYFIFNNKRIGSGTPNEFQEININALATIRNRMNVDLPGFTDYGIQSFSTISTAVGTKLKIKLDIPKKHFSFTWEMPQRPMQLLSLTRRNYFIDDYRLREIPDYNVNRINEDWCSNRLVQYLGVEVCHSKSYPNVIYQKDKPWTLMAGSSHWNYELKNVVKHRIAYELDVNMVHQNDKNQSVTETALRLLDSGDKPKDIFKYSWIQKDSGENFKADLTTPLLPDFYLTVKGEELHNGFQFSAEASTYGISNKFTYLAEESSEKRDAATISNRLSKSFGKKLVDVKVITKAINISTSDNFYHWNYKHHKMPKSDVYNQLFLYKSAHDRWLENILGAGTFFWEDRETAWVELHRETYLDDDESRPLSLQAEKSYNYLKIPGSIIQLHTNLGSPSNKKRVLHLNLTKHYLPDHRLATFFNFSDTEETKGDNEVEWVLKETSLIIPGLSLSFDRQYRTVKENGQEYTKWIFTKGTPTRKVPPHSDEPVRFWWPGTDKNEATIVVLEVEENPKTEEESHSWSNLKSMNGNLTLLQTSGEGSRDVLLKKILATFQSDAQAFDSETLEWTFTIDAPEKFLWHTVAKSTPNCTIGCLSFNSTFIHKSSGIDLTHSLVIVYQTAKYHIHDYVVTMSYTVNPNIYRLDSILSLVFWSNFLIELNITASSPLWSLLDVDLRQKVYVSNEIMSMTHQLVDIDVAANWTKGYHKTFHFKSKNPDFIPNMLWKMDFDDFLNGNIQLTFLDTMADIYILFETPSLQMSEIILTLCYDKKCKDLQQDRDSFIQQWIFSLDDTKHLTHTIIYNPDMEYLLLNFNTYAFKSRLTWDRLYAEQTPIADWSRYASSVKRTVMRYFEDILSPIHNATTPIVQPTGLITYQFGKYTLYKLGNIFQKTYAGWFWNYFEVNENLPAWLLMLGNRLLIEYDALPGPIPGKSTTNRYLLPWTMGKLLDLETTNFNPEFVRNLKIYFEDFLTMPPLRNIFYDDNYDRFALFVGNGDVYTFERAFKRFRPVTAGCAYLLSQDVASKNFTIYYQDSKIHFLFRDLKLVISSDGSTFINDSRHDLPFENWNGKILASRRESIVELKTEYNLKVICNVHQFFCVFYTKIASFNLLRGALGNNNDVPNDHSWENVPFQLSDPNSCQKSTSYQQLFTNGVYQRSDLTQSDNFWISSCHDIVSNKVVFLSYAHKLACVSLNAYLATCSAYGVPIWWPPEICYAASCDPIEVSSSRNKSLYNVESKKYRVHMSQNLEVIFLIDQTTRSNPGSFVKGVEQLASAIHKQFIEEGYKNVKFGLVGFGRQGLLPQPQQHTINGNVMGSAKEFADSCLKTLVFNGAVNTTSSQVISAIEYATDSYSFAPDSVHMFILITPTSSIDQVESPALRTVKKLDWESVTLYTISNYLGLGSKSKGLYGIRGDGYIFPQPKSSQADAYMTFPEGQYAKLSSATRGAIWQLSHLETNLPEKAYLYSIADEMVAKGRQDGTKCKICECTYPLYYQPKASCQFVKCSGEKSQ